MSKIVAVVTTRMDGVAGGAPIFAAADRSQAAEMANRIEKIMDCMVHQLSEEVYIVVDHSVAD
jgi:hypothetical protein